MKTNLFFIGLFLCLLFGYQINIQAQSDFNINLLFNWQDTVSIQPSACGACGNHRYNEVWGYVADGREYAIIGSTAGVHILDVTEPQNTYLIDFVAGSFAGQSAIHRDFDDYNGYLYMVGDQGDPETHLQIIDLKNLPNSVELVYSSNELLSTTHNIFIDKANARLYASGMTDKDGIPHAVGIFSIENPTEPTFLTYYDEIGYAHDLYVRDNIAFLNAINDGLFIVDFTNPNEPISLGSLTEYGIHGQGYNHSGWLNDAGNIYAFADENHGLSVKIADVSDFGDIKVLSTLSSGEAEKSIAHNLIFKDDFLFVSYYHDGLQVFDLSDPTNPKKVAAYDTYMPDEHENYKGAWGVYPYLPSGNILVSDMQSGLFVLRLEGIEGLGDLTTSVAFNDNASVSKNMNVQSHFLQNELWIQLPEPIEEDIVFEVFDINGRLMYQEEIFSIHNHQQYVLDVPFSTHSMLIVQAKTMDKKWVSKVIY